MTAAHTPGPWVSNDLSQRVHTADDVTIARCEPHSTDVAKANARLIAAAPELLAFVEKIDRWIQRSEDDDCEYLNGEGWDDLRILQVAARAAIAKARGAA